MLNDLMEFDHVVQIHSDGSVTDAPQSLYAPSVYDGELDTDGWELLNGYSGQDGYAGPIMHASEYVGGRMEQDILAQPGYYAVVACYSLDDDDIDGWAVAYQSID